MCESNFFPGVAKVSSEISHLFYEIMALMCG